MSIECTQMQDMQQLEGTFRLTLAACGDGSDLAILYGQLALDCARVRQVHARRCSICSLHAVEQDELTIMEATAVIQ